MTARAVRTARRERGFSLLEVMVAVAILSIALSGLTMTLSRAVRAANHARLMTTATFLCRQKLVETEDKFIVDGFTDEAGIKEESGDFKEQIYQNANLGKYTWSRTIERVRLPAAADMQQAATKMLQDRQQIGGGSSARTAALSVSKGRSSVACSGRSAAPEPAPAVAESPVVAWSGRSAPPESQAAPEPAVALSTGSASTGSASTVTSTIPSPMSAARAPRSPSEARTLNRRRPAPFAHRAARAPALPASSRGQPAPQDQRGIHAAKTKPVEHGMREGHGPGPQRDQVQPLSQRIGPVQVQCARHHLIAQRQRGEDGRHRTGRAQQVPGGRLGGADGHRRVRTKHPPDCGQLAPVAHAGGGGVRVQVLHVLRREARLRQRGPPTCCARRRHRLRGRR